MKPVFFVSAALFSSVLVFKPYSSFAQTTLPSAKDISPPLTIASQLQNSFVAVAAKIRPSVVTIYAERLPATTSTSNAAPDGADEPLATPDSPVSPPLPDDSQASLGSGMVLDNQGHILTNYHVVKDASVIRVMADSNADSPPRPVAKLIGYDQESDLAVLQVAPSPAFVPVQFGESSDLHVGDWVLAVGAPFDQTQTVTVGVISAKGRHLTKDGQLSLQDYIQTDAAINPGNSGGPLVNMRGEVIGINTAILSPSRYSVGIGFAVPSDTIQHSLPTLLQGKQVKRGFLGIRYLPLSPDVAKAFGVPGGMQIGALAQQDEKPYGPAYDAGLRQGDVITAINGKAVTISEQFRNYVATLLPGTTVQLQILRPLKQGMQQSTFEIQLGDRNSDYATAITPIASSSLNLPQIGLNVEDTRGLTASQRSMLGQSSVADKEGNQVIILHVSPGSSADDAQLRQGEIIEKINILTQSVSGTDNLGTWQTITDKNQLIELVHDQPVHTKILIQLQDKQEIDLYKMLVSAGL